MTEAAVEEVIGDTESFAHSIDGHTISVIQNGRTVHRCSRFKVSESVQGAGPEILRGFEPGWGVVIETFVVVKAKE
ncbi:hypothetical protein GCM10009689_22730 [Brevibacterium antiquum]